MRTRADVLAYRIHAQQLDRPAAPRELTDAAIFDFGMQDTGRDGASWALANRGVPVGRRRSWRPAPTSRWPGPCAASPHYYRRAELFDVMVATSPMSEADAVRSGSSAPTSR